MSKFAPSCTCSRNSGRFGLVFKCTSFMLRHAGSIMRSTCPIAHTRPTLRMNSILYSALYTRPSTKSPSSMMHGSKSGSPSALMVKFSRCSLLLYTLRCCCQSLGCCSRTLVYSQIYHRSFIASPGQTGLSFSLKRDRLFVNLCVKSLVTLYKTTYCDTHDPATLAAKSSNLVHI